MDDLEKVEYWLYQGSGLLCDSCKVQHHGIRHTFPESLTGDDRGDAEDCAGSVEQENSGSCAVSREGTVADSAT